VISMEDWEKKRRDREFRDLFSMIDEFIREIEKEFYRFFNEIEFSPFTPLSFGKEGEYKIMGPYVYGFRITIGPDGKPIIEEFGNVKRVRGKPKISEEREPLVDVFENDDEIIVVAEIPGVEKENIKVEVSDDKRRLIIRASDEKRKYYKEVELPAEVDPESAKANYKNGVLEVRLKKVKSKEKKKYEIKVE